MNLYGDRGNIIALKRRAEWRGWEVVVVAVEAGDPISWRDCDLLFMGGGEDRHQSMVADDFLQRASDIKAAAADGLPMLTICGGFQLMGHYYETATGQKLPGLGWYDAHTAPGSGRSIGDVVVEADLPIEPRTLVGFENHGGQTFLHEGQAPLGRILAGHGNNGQDHQEGAIRARTIGTYLHGSLLPKNPQLTDWILAGIQERRLGQRELSPLDNSWELRAHFVMTRRSLGVRA